MYAQMAVQAFTTALPRVLSLTLALAAMASPPKQAAANPPGSKPGPEHELLKSFEGDFELTFKAPKGDCKGTNTCKVGLGGFWLLEHVKSEFDGQAYEGRGALTYDPEKKKYVHIWIDSMSPSPIISEGTYDKENKTLTLTGTMVSEEGKPMKVTLKSVLKDANTRTFALNGTGPDGKGIEIVHITLKRKAK